MAVLDMHDTCEAQDSSPIALYEIYKSSPEAQLTDLSGFSIQFRCAI